MTEPPSRRRDRTQRPRVAVVACLLALTACSTPSASSSDAAPAPDDPYPPEAGAGPTDAAPAADAGPADPDAGRGAGDAGGADDAAPAADARPDAAGPAPDSGDCASRRWYADADADGAGDPATSQVACGQPAGFVDNSNDCDDASPAIGPDAAERCNGLDDDCDGTADNDAADSTPYFFDEDADGFGDPTRPTYACARPAGHADTADDCNDGAADVGDCAGGLCSRAGRCVDLGHCADPRDCPADHVCDDLGACVPGSLCGGQAFDARRVRANLLVVLDRSCSMRERVGGVRKWQAAVDAIDALTREFADDLRFGLALFPDTEGGNCRQGAMPVPLADDGGPAVRDLLRAALDNADRYWPDGPCVTNIDGGMVQAANDPALVAPDRASAVLLVTDGEQAGCDVDGGNAGTVRAIEALWGRGVPTYVVGFDAEVNAQWLTRFADAGGAPRADDPRYYPAGDAAGLVATLRGIAGRVASCDLRLDAAPPDPLGLSVFFDARERVLRDPTHTEGFDYDPATQTVTLYGEACERLRDNRVSDVTVVFGCAYEP